MDLFPSHNILFPAFIILYTLRVSFLSGQVPSAPMLFFSFCQASGSIHLYTLLFIYICAHQVIPSTPSTHYLDAGNPHICSYCLSIYAKLWDWKPNSFLDIFIFWNFPFWKHIFLFPLPSELLPTLWSGPLPGMFHPLLFTLSIRLENSNS